MTGIIFMTLTIVQFPYNMIETRNALRNFDNDRELYSYSPIDSSGTYDVPSTVSLSRSGRFELKVYCDEAIGRKNTPFTVSLSLNANISGVMTIITLAQTSYSKTSYFEPDGTQIVDPIIDKSWKSQEYDAATYMTLNFSWSSNFNGWYLKVLYLNDTLSSQRSTLAEAKTAASVSFGVGLGLSITSFVIGIIGTVFSTVYHVVKKRRSQ